MSYQPLCPIRPITVDALYSVHYFEYSSDYSFAGERHDFWELLYVDKGELTVTAGEKQLELVSGQIIFHEPGEFHALSARDGTAPDLVVLSFSCASEAMHILSGCLTTIGAEERALLGRIVEESCTAFETPLGDPTTQVLLRRRDAPFGAEQRITAALEELLIRIIRQQTGTAGKRDPEADPESAWLASMEDYLRARLDQPLTLEQICRDNLIGRSQLQKRFHAQTGGGVMAYFAKMKIQTARRLIREGNLNVTQIAAQLGYQSVHYFSRHFKQHTGMSPSQYAKSVKMLSGLPGTPVDDRTNNV